MECRRCGICCIAVSIKSRMPNGRMFYKQAGERCQHLTLNNTCGVWGDAHQQPDVCRSIKPQEDLCFPGLSPRQHYKALTQIDRRTRVRTHEKRPG